MDRERSPDKAADIRAYWAYADRLESKLMEEIDQGYDGLFDEITGIASRYQSLDGFCTAREVEQLHGRIRRWKEESPSSFYAAKLYFRDMENRRRIRKEEALFLWLLSAFTGVYLKIASADKKLLLQVSAETFRKHGGTGAETAAGLDRFLAQGLPDGTSYNRQLSSYAEYAAHRFTDCIRMGRMQGGGPSEQELETLLEAAKNRLLKRSKPSEGQPINYHGYLDQVMTSVVGYTVMRVFRESGVKRYRFIATIDERTTSACRWLNGKVFNVADMKLGVNAPPITIDYTGAPIPHPCRSIIRAVE